MSESTCIVLEERLTIAQAAALHRSFCEALAGSAAVTIDAARVEEIDTAILQLLCVVQRSAARRGILCAWRGVSESLCRSAALIGLSDSLHLPHAAEGSRDAAA
jgi:anti-anti-sigma regulatory factor